MSELARQFATLAVATQMTSASVSTVADIPAAVSSYLRALQTAAMREEPGLSSALATRSGTGRVRIATDIRSVSAEDWRAGGVEAVPPPVRTDGDVYVGECYAAVAGQGAIVLHSRAGHALASEFLAATHIAVLRASRIVASLGDLWALWRREYPNSATLPREFCLVTGPSRTADLGLPAKLGAHGPARVHVIIDTAA